MREHNFDEILDFLCSGIMSKKERENVRDELYDHLMCKYETYLAMGLDEESATEKSIKELGNKNTIRENLQKVHWYYPAQSLKSAIYVMILANFLPSLFVLLGLLPISVLYMPVFCIAAVMLRLVSAYMMRPANEKFRYAFICEIISAVSIIGLIAVYPIEFENNEVLFSALGVVFILLLIVSCFLNFLGLKELIKPYSDDKVLNNLNHYLLSNLTLFYLVRDVLDLNSHFSAFGSSVYLLFFVVSACIFINQMLKISDILYKCEHEYKVEISVKKRYVVCLIVVAFSVLSICGVDYTVSTFKHENVIYSIDDCEIDEHHYKRICDNLISYGVPEEYVELLPKSEIVKYWNSVNKSELTESASKIYGSFNHGLEEIRLEAYDGSVIVRNYAIGLQEASDEISVRFLKIFTVHSVSEDVKAVYNDCILFDDSCLNTSGYTVPETTDNRGDLLLELHITDNIVCQGKGKQLYLRPDDYKNYQYIKGAKFKPEPGTVIIYATTRKLADINSTEACLNYTYFHQQRPILFPIRTVEKLIDIQEYLTIEKNKYYYIFNQESFLVYKENDSCHHWVMPGYEYNLPKKSKLEVK